VTPLGLCPIGKTKMESLIHVHGSGSNAQMETLWPCEYLFYIYIYIYFFFVWKKVKIFIILSSVWLQRIGRRRKKNSKL
jgi:hypothetical protein